MSYFALPSKDDLSKIVLLAGPVAIVGDDYLTGK